MLLARHGDKSPGDEAGPEVLGARKEGSAPKKLTNVDEAAVVLEALERTSNGLLLLLRLGDLGGLTTNLTGTGERTVNLT